MTTLGQRRIQFTRRAVLVISLCLIFMTAAPAALAFDCTQNRHDFVVIERVEPTHTRDGHVISRCRLCDVQFTETLFATGCQWSDWRVYRAPTCTQEGLRIRTCSVGGGHSETEPLPALGHNLVTRYTEACCTYHAQRITSCTRCDYTRSEEIGDLEDCQYLEEITREPCCGIDGELTFTCAVCGSARSEVLLALRHDWEDWIVTIPAEEGLEGLETSTCRNCGEVRERIIPALLAPPPPLPPAQNPPFFGIYEAAAVGVNIAAWIGLFFLLSGEIALLMWNRKKKRELLAEKDFHDKGLDGYEYI